MKLILVEDNPADVRLIREMLKESDGRYDLTVVGRLDKALEAMKESAPDAVLIDLGLPDSQGIATVQAVLAAQPQIPIVVLTGIDDKLLATESLRLGAQEFQ